VTLGLGKENAILFTINPLKFVNTYLKNSPTIIVDNKKIEDNNI
jgi:hypothetical protein